jgi:hypothetical protein
VLSDRWCVRAHRVIVVCVVLMYMFRCVRLCDYSSVCLVATVSVVACMLCRSVINELAGVACPRSSSLCGPPEAVMSAIGAACPAAAVVDDAVEAVCGAESVAVVPGASKAIPSTPNSKAGGAPRGKCARKPKIDIDNEIQEANRLADLFKKMQAASKVAARNAHRSKQRLIRKANKLSEQDLMRLAVLKRCGLIVPDEEAGIEASPVSASAPPPAKKTKAQEHISNRFKTLVCAVPGASEVLDGLAAADASAAAAKGSCAAAASSSSLPPVEHLPFLRRLPSHRSTKASPPQAAEAKPLMEVEADGEEDGSGTEDAVDAEAPEE